MNPFLSRPAFRLVARTERGRKELQTQLSAAHRLRAEKEAEATASIDRLKQRYAELFSGLDHLIGDLEAVLSEIEA